MKYAAQRLVANGYGILTAPPVVTTYRVGLVRDVL